MYPVLLNSLSFSIVCRMFSICSRVPGINPACFCGISGQMQTLSFFLYAVVSCQHGRQELLFCNLSIVFLFLICRLAQSLMSPSQLARLLIFKSYCIQCGEGLFLQIFLFLTFVELLNFWFLILGPSKYVGMIF